MRGLPEPPLSLVYQETFDDGITEFFTLGPGWSLVPQDNGQILQVNESDASAAINYSGLHQVVVQVRIRPQSGIARLAVRESALGAYNVTLDSTGLLQLFRADQPVDAVAFVMNEAIDWHTLRLSVIDSTVQVSLDGVPRLVFIDPSPLPAGVTALYGIGTILVDDFQLWLPTNDPAADPLLWTTQEFEFGSAAMQSASQMLYLGEPQGGINVHSTTSMSGWWPLSHSLTVEYNDPVVGMLFPATYQLHNPYSPFPWREIRGGALVGTGMYGRSHLEEGGAGQACFMASGDFGQGWKYGEANCAAFFPESKLGSRQTGFPASGSQGQVYQQLFEVWTAQYSGANYIMGPTRFIYYGTPPIDETPTPSPTPTFTPTPLALDTLVVEFDLARYDSNTDCNTFPSGEPLPGQPNTGDRVKCWIHQSIIEWMQAFSISTFDHQQVMELIVESEYRAYISYFSPPHIPWLDEAVARRFYDVVYGCGLNGCQTLDDQLYMFLSAFQAPRNYVLDDVQLVINSIRRAADEGNPYWQTEVAHLEAAVNRIFNPPVGENWTGGVVSDQPYGWATRIGVLDADSGDLHLRLSYCNLESFAYRIDDDPNDGVQNIFFGVTVQTQGQTITTPYGNVTCSFIP